MGDVGAEENRSNRGVDSVHRNPATVHRGAVLKWFTSTSKRTTTLDWVAVLFWWSRGESNPCPKAT